MEQMSKKGGGTKETREKLGGVKGKRFRKDEGWRDKLKKEEMEEENGNMGWSRCTKHLIVLKKQLLVGFDYILHLGAQIPQLPLSFLGF